jgi:hypothetical protein
MKISLDEICRIYASRDHALLVIDEFHYENIYIYRPKSQVLICLTNERGQIMIIAYDHHMNLIFSNIVKIQLQTQMELIFDLDPFNIFFI